MSYNPSIVNSYRNRDYKIHFYEKITGQQVSFDSYLVSFTDSYEPQWETMEQGINQQDVYKRPTVVTRKISIGFVVPSATLNESIVNLEKIRTLARFLYPPTNGGTSTSDIQGSSEILVKFLNLICDYDYGPIQVFIDQVSINPIVDEGFFDPSPGVLYPKTLRVDLSFTAVTKQLDPASGLYPTEEEEEEAATQPPSPPATANPATQVQGNLTPAANVTQTIVPPSAPQPQLQQTPSQTVQPALAETTPVLDSKKRPTKPSPRVSATSPKTPKRTRYTTEQLLAIADGTLVATPDGKLVPAGSANNSSQPNIDGANSSSEQAILNGP
jgi:hypothetical protein